MSSQPESASSSPESTGDSSVDSAAQSRVAVEPPAAVSEPPRKPPIRIGTQRYGVKVPTAIAQPVLPSPPAELLGRSTAQAAPEAAAPEAATSEEDSGQAPDTKPAKPQASTGKQRAPKPAVESRPTHKYPPPNIRAQLSPELEVEFLAALGGESMEDVMAVGSPETIVAELEPESRHKGKVISVHRDNVFLEIAGHHQGIAPLKDFATPPEPGTMLDVMISRFNAADGLYELALPGTAVDVGDWSEVAEGMLVEARVTGHNKGGLECEVNQLRGFIPASQVSMYRVEDLSQFVDQKFPCIVTEVNPAKRNLVLSRRAVLERDAAEAKEKLLAELEPGQMRDGIVRSLQPFGAFVDLGGVDGLIHISQMSWDRVKHPSEVLEVGQKVSVKIQKIDPQTGKISLAYRDLTESPWATAAQDYPARSTVKGTVSRLMEFGAFVRLGPGVEGLVHISELSHKRVFRVSDVLTEGQEVEVQVQSVDSEQQRISLSLKALEARPTTQKAAAEPEEPEAPPEPPKKRKTPLRGGIGGPPTGDQFGLKW